MKLVVDIIIVYTIRHEPYLKDQKFLVWVAKGFLALV